jgi:flagellar hook-associated protein 3 FlgL
MRISSGQITSRLLQEIQFSRRRLFEVQERVSTGLQIRRPADDPPGVNKLIMMRTTLDQNEQYRRNITVARSDLEVTESAYAQLGSVMQRAYELALQGANGAIGAADRADIALEVSQLLTEAIAIGNTSHAGRYLFAGHQTATAPFVPDVAATPTVVNYVGDAGLVRREIAQGELVESNIVGSRGYPAVFGALISLRDNLLADNQTAVGVDVATVSNALDGMLVLRSEVGVKMSRTETADERLLDEEAMVQSLIAEIEEADFAESIVQLQQRETAYQAALSSAGRALNLSLMQFLR